MNPITLLYHDVVPRGNPDASGFLGSGATIYKLDRQEFQLHLNAIRSVLSKGSDTPDLRNRQGRPVLLTFDDGGCSAHEPAADLLEAAGCRGYFFVTTNWIGKSGFLNSTQIRDLHRRGHRIGTHSCSHPARMSYCTREELDREWNNSVRALSEIIGEPITLASVPGGFYGQNVAESAGEAGICTLFTSEPQTSIRVVIGCTVLGRYTIQQGVKASTAAAIANGNVLPRCRQSFYWNAKKVAKIAGGTQWLRLRQWVLASRSDL